MGEDERTLLELGKVKPLEEEEQTTQVVSTGKHSKSTKPEASLEEGKRTHPPPPWTRRHPCLACCGLCLLIFLVIIIVLIILGFTLFKPRNPRIHVDSITLDSFEISLPASLFAPSLSLNATLGLALSLRNPNFASIKYSNSTAHMSYRGMEVGSIPIPAGHVHIRRTEHIISTVELMADRFIGSSHIIPDLISGSLPLSTSTRISGHVKVFNVFKHHFHSSSVCDITILILNRSISDTVCDYDLDL